MKVCIGLGNPGRKYENTRHNAGFMVMDRLADLCKVSFDQEKFSAYFAKTKIQNEDVILLKPTTFMNNSGFALRQCMDFYKISTHDVLVIYDDVDLPVGKIRLCQKGSAGGHNGIKSIIQCIFTNEFDRIRVGVGKNPQIDMIHWVLGQFQDDEKEPLKEAVEQSAQAAYYSLTHSFMDTMNQYNKK